MVEDDLAFIVVVGMAAMAVLAAVFSVVLTRSAQSRRHQRRTPPPDHRYHICRRAVWSGRNRSPAYHGTGLSICARCGRGDH